MSKNLKPCPFCGSKNVVVCPDPADQRDHMVMCNDCGACGPACSHAEKAIKLWNRGARRTCYVCETHRPISLRQILISKICSECGHVFGYMEQRPVFSGYEETMMFGNVDVPNYCPQCGAKVVK